MSTLKSILTRKVTLSKKQIKYAFYGYLICILLSALLALTGCVTQRGFPPVMGIQNYDDVSQHLCRGAQENKFGAEFLKSQDVTLVINLRNTGDTWDREPAVVTSLGMRYLWVPLKGFGAPTRAQVNFILAMIEDEIKHGGKVFVHCQHGCDRTGLIIACYEIRHGFSNAKALDDAYFHGLSPFETGMIEFIKKFK
jgi:protein tyrosine phosphatase (PTP) superfamily phosphohydrolase (DUF442 family)